MAQVSPYSQWLLRMWAYYVLQSQGSPALPPLQGETLQHALETLTLMCLCPLPCWCTPHMSPHGHHVGSHGLHTNCRHHAASLPAGAPLPSMADTLAILISVTNVSNR